MINVDEYKILSSNISTLKETSRDKHYDSEYYMTESILPAIDFDKVKNQYITSLKLSGDIPKSNDALMISADGRQVFIEFKNGSLDKARDKFALRKKIYDSLLIYPDIIKQGISYTREYMDYILVYNEVKNLETKEDQKTKVQKSESRDTIARSISKLGCTNFVKYGLEIFKSYCFKEVYTFTEQEFQDYLDEL